VSERTPQRRLVRKYVVVLLVLVGGVLMVSSLVELYFSYQQTKRAIVRVERAKAEGAAARIEQFMKEVERQLRETTQAASDDPTAAQIGGGKLAFRAGLGTAMAEQRELDFLRLLRNEPVVTEISHLDVAGKEQLRVSRLEPDALGSQQDFSSAPKFRETRSGKTYVSPVYLRNGAEPHVTLAVPVGTYAVEVTAAEISLKSILKLIAQIDVGPKGVAYVVDSRARLFAHPDLRLASQLRDLSALPQIVSARAARPLSPDDDPVVTVAAGLQGGEVLAAHAAIAPLGWLVLVERPLADAYAPLQAPIIRSAAIFVLGLGLSILASLVLARRMVAPIRVLQAGAARIGAGELGHRIEVRTGDELQALAEEFNRTAAQLQESYAGLEQKVELRTRELSKALEEVRALGEISQAVSSTLDLPTVLRTIVERAAQLSGADSAVLYEYDAALQQFQPRTPYRLEREHFEALQATPLRLGEGAVGKAAASRAPVEVPDLRAESEFTAALIWPILVRSGYRSILAVPLLHEQDILGGLVVWRRESGSFAPGVVNLLQTFATQSALAIQNARLFRELEDKSHQLEVASAHKSQFLANMSHELRTPLNAIIGFSDVLLEGMFGETNEKQTEYLRDILGSGKHLLSLINDILDLSKIEAGQMELDLTDFDVPGAIGNALTLMRERASRHGIELTHVIDDELAEIRADERKFKQVLLNLLSNAVKFTPGGGKVQVQARHVDDMVEVAVADTGEGIATENHAAVFEEFRQVGTSSKKIEGTGLGLALCRKFVELQGGTIRLESQLGVGSTFTFTLPRHVRRASEASG
jgi:signal transduction histidine kinase